MLRPAQDNIGRACARKQAQVGEIVTDCQIPATQKSQAILFLQDLHLLSGDIPTEAAAEDSCSDFQLARDITRMQVIRQRRDNRLQAGRCKNQLTCLRVSVHYIPHLTHSPLGEQLRSILTRASLQIANRVPSQQSHEPVFQQMPASSPLQ